MNSLFFLKGYVSIAFLWRCIFLQGTAGSVSEKKLIHNILRNYDARVRPVTNFRKIINVTFSLTIQQIVDLDEKNQLLTTSMYMGWEWKDAFLQWIPEEYDGIESIRLPAEYVWKPDILVYNSAVPSFDQMLKTNVVIRHTGQVEWLPPGLFQTTCDVDIRYFPFDEQQCLIKFGAWTHHGGLIDLQLNGVHAVNDSYTPSGEWSLLSMIGKRTAKGYECCGNVTFVDITYTVHLKRRTLFYGFNLLLPCVLICFLTVLVFLLPADSGERITLGITVLLALVVFLQLVAENLPPTDVIPLLGKYFACSIFVVAGSVLATVVSLNFHHTNASNCNEMPATVRWLFLHFLPKILRMKRPGQNSFRKKFLDSTEDAEYHTRGINGYPVSGVGDGLKEWRKMKSDPIKDFVLLKDAHKEIGDILDEVLYITNRIRSVDKDESTALEWKFAATVLDSTKVFGEIVPIFLNLTKKQQQQFYDKSHRKILSLLFLSLFVDINSSHNRCCA